MTWRGDPLFAVQHLILKDFRVRYRNMSLGFFWSLLNPLIMMGVLTFVFTVIFPNPSIPHFWLFVLCGLVPYNFFTLALANGSVSITENVALIKRVPVPRELIPLASVLSNSIHLLIQIALLLALVLYAGLPVTRHWIWLPVIWIFLFCFVAGLALMTASMNVSVRDMRYVVESFNTVLFWLVPIFYSFAAVPTQFADIYQFNPIAAVVLAQRNILLEAKSPSTTLILKLAASSMVALGLGFAVMRRLRDGFYDHI